jgi:hypothetical protein
MVDTANSEISEWGAMSPVMVIDEAPSAVSGIGMNENDGFDMSFSDVQSEVVRTMNREAICAIAGLRSMQIIRVWPKTWCNALRMEKMPHRHEDRLRAGEIANGRPKGCNDGSHEAAMAVCLGETWGMSGYKIPMRSGISRALRL